MQCLYKYKEDIVVGKNSQQKRHKAGDQCQSHFACADQGDPKYGYCFRHAIQLKLVPEQEMKKFDDSRVKGVIKSRHGREGDNWGNKTKERKKAAQALLSEENKKKELEIGQEKEKETKELIHKLLGDQEFNAAEMMEDLKGANADFKYTDKQLKFVFIMWYASDALTRKPETLKELCRILNISYTQGLDWIDSDWFTTDLTNTMKKTMMLAKPYLDRVNLGRALSGDFNSYKEYNRLYAKKDIKEGEVDWDDELPEDVKREAEETMESN